MQVGVGVSILFACVFFRWLKSQITGLDVILPYQILPSFHRFTGPIQPEHVKYANHDFNI